MTINELRDYLAKYTGEGKGGATVLICALRDNPLEKGMEIADAAFIEWIDGEGTLVIQTSKRGD